MTLFSLALFAGGCGSGGAALNDGSGGSPGQPSLDGARGEVPPDDGSGGSPVQASPDGGPGDGQLETQLDDPVDAAFDPSLTGRHSFDVTATIQLTGSSPPRSATSEFTLVLDADARQIIVGAQGRGAVVPVKVTGGSTFRAAEPFNVGGGLLGAPGSGPPAASFESLEVTVSGASLAGRASGTVLVLSGDSAGSSPFSGAVSGTADVTAPFLVGTGEPFDPFESLWFLASEPLPATARASLVSTSGSRVDLLPTFAEGTDRLITGFMKPDVVLRFGEQYVVSLDGLVDFAGHAGAADTPLRLGDTPAAPLAAEDGFESVTGATFGGAAVISDAAAVISGTRSLYVGAPDAPPLGTIAAGRSLVVRLAVQPGDTKITFSARGVGRTEDGFRGQVQVGSVGHRPAPLVLAPELRGRVDTPVPGGPMVYLSAAQNTEVQLPTDHADEVVVAIGPVTSSTKPVGGILIDDLRVE